MIAEFDLDTGGMRVIESAYLEQDGEPYTVRRTWCERLLGRPWRPWVATREVVPRIPYRGAVRLNATTLVMHPEILRKLRRELDERANREFVEGSGTECGGI